MNIFLIGFMGAGKTSVAQEMSRKYGLRLVEMDGTIEARQGRAISRIFEEEGEAYFRDLETELLKELQSEDDAVISCGGGVPLREENVTIMKNCGIVVYLSAEPETIYERVKDTHTRPLLEEDNSPAHIWALLSRRLPAYLSAADLTVTTDGRTVEEICSEIINTV